MTSRVVPAALLSLGTVAVAIGAVMASGSLPAARAQTSAPAQKQNTQQGSQSAAPPVPVVVDGWNRPLSQLVKQPEGPAPRRDISGTWEPARSPGDGVQAIGSHDMPADGKPEHDPPYTALGLELMKKTKPSNGVRSVLPADTNDPVVLCEPTGMPRADLYNLRTTQIMQAPRKLSVLYEFERVWRTIWTDGREAPKDPDPRYYGYSVGKWVDDYTLVVQTTGTDERTWIDRAGRPHSEDLRIEERFHRVDHNHLELTVTITDPKMYTKPWVPMDKFPFKLQPEDFDVIEMLCSPAEIAAYNKVVGTPATRPRKK
jgi:hypothetical protein